MLDLLKDENIEKYHFVYILFLAIGCTNMIPPEDAWIKREDDKIIIGCYTSRQTWQLRCHDGRWTGVVSNCSKRMFLLNTQNSLFVTAYLHDLAPSSMTTAARLASAQA